MGGVSHCKAARGMQHEGQSHPVGSASPGATSGAPAPAAGRERVCLQTGQLPAPGRCSQSQPMGAPGHPGGGRRRGSWPQTGARSRGRTGRGASRCSCPWAGLEQGGWGQGREWAGRAGGGRASRAASSWLVVALPCCQAAPAVGGCQLSNSGQDRPLGHPPGPWIPLLAWHPLPTPLLKANRSLTQLLRLQFRLAKVAAGHDHVPVAAEGQGGGAVEAQAAGGARDDDGGLLGCRGGVGLGGGLGGVRHSGGAGLQAAAARRGGGCGAALRGSSGGPAPGRSRGAGSGVRRSRASVVGFGAVQAGIYLGRGYRCPAAGSRPGSPGAGPESRLGAAEALLSLQGARQGERRPCPVGGHARTRSEAHMALGHGRALHGGGHCPEIKIWGSWKGQGGPARRVAVAARRRPVSTQPGQLQDKSE